MEPPAHPTIESENSAAKKLFEIIQVKQTFLGLVIDSTSLQETLQLLPFVANHICLLKLFVEQYHDFTWNRIVELKNLSIQYNFMILDDSKFADGNENSIKIRYINGYYSKAYWADFVTVHFIEGSSILDHLKTALLEAKIHEPRGAFVITEMADIEISPYTDMVLKALLSRLRFNNPNFIASIVQKGNALPIDRRIHRLPIEEINLEESIEKINYYVSALLASKSNICFLKLSDYNQIEKIKTLQQGHWQEYQKIHVHHN